MTCHHDFPPLTIPKELLAGWQSATEIMAEVMNVPVGLITRFREKKFEILVGNRGGENPFRSGEEMSLLGSGSYCDEVIRVRGLLNVPNARQSSSWDSTPLALEGFIAYFGMPLFLPGGKIYGTLSVMDRRPRLFNGTHEALLFRFRDLVETQIALLFLHRDHKEKIRVLGAYRDELAQLREVFPICPSCKRIRNDSDYWDAVEEYFVTHSMGEFGHGLCPECSEEHWGETLLPPEPVPLPRGLGAGGPAKA